MWNIFKVKVTVGSSAFIVYFEKISHIVLVFPLLILNK